MPKKVKPEELIWKTEVIYDKELLAWFVEQPDEATKVVSEMVARRFRRWVFEQKRKAT